MTHSTKKHLPEYLLGYAGVIFIDFCPTKKIFKIHLEDYVLHKNEKKVFQGLITKSIQSRVNKEFPNVRDISTTYSIKLSTLNYRDTCLSIDTAVFLVSNKLADIIGGTIRKIKSNNCTYWRIYYKLEN